MFRKHFVCNAKHCKRVRIWKFRIASSTLANCFRKCSLHSIDFHFRSWLFWHKMQKCDRWLYVLVFSFNCEKMLLNSHFSLFRCVDAQGERTSAEEWTGCSKENEKLFLASSQELASDKTHFNSKFCFQSFLGFQRLTYYCYDYS